jgi:hypothetical protein
LPSSHLLTDQLSKSGSAPVAGGGFGDVWEGMYNDRQVAIKVLRMYQVDEPEKLIKVSTVELMATYSQ